MPSRIVNLLVGPESDGMRLDAFLASAPDMPSRSACARLVEEGAVTINETPATSKSERVLLGDRVRALVGEEQPQGGPLAPNPYIDLDVRFGRPGQIAQRAFGVADDHDRLGSLGGQTRVTDRRARSGPRGHPDDRGWFRGCGRGHCDGLLGSMPDTWSSPGTCCGRRPRAHGNFLMLSTSARTANMGRASWPSTPPRRWSA